MRTKNEIEQMVIDMGIILEEEIIPHMLQRNYWEEFKKFGTWESWNCFEDQVKRMNSIILLYELISDCDIGELEKVLNGFED